MPDNTRSSSTPKFAKEEMVLARCLMEGDADTTARARSRRRKTFGASLGIELMLLVVLVAVPLLTTVAQPQLRRDLPEGITFIRGPHSPVIRQAVRPATTNHAASPVLSQTEIPRPIFGIRRIPPAGEEIADVGPAEISGGIEVPGGIEVAEIGRQLPVPPHVDPPRPAEKRPVHVSEGVLEGQLISRVEPQYPFIAVETKTEGEVRLHAIISRDGRITALEVVSGSPLLVKAALEAVRQWRYRPTLLNGEPVEVDTSITVIFHLHPR
jgi:protein TonB